MALLGRVLTVMLVSARGKELKKYPITAMQRINAFSCHQNVRKHFNLKIPAHPCLVRVMYLTR